MRVLKSDAVADHLNFLIRLQESKQALYQCRFCSKLPAWGALFRMTRCPRTQGGRNAIHQIAYRFNPGADGR